LNFIKKGEDKDGKRMERIGACGNWSGARNDR